MSFPEYVIDANGGLYKIKGYSPNHDPNRKPYRYEGVDVNGKTNFNLFSDSVNPVTGSQVSAFLAPKPAPIDLSKDELHRIADKMDQPGEGTWARKLGPFLHALASYADAEHFRANVEANRSFIERYR